MVRVEVVKEMTKAALVTMGQVGGSEMTAQELLSASFTLVQNMIDTIIELSTPEDLVFNRTSMVATLQNMAFRIQPTGLVN